jgi:hypothetical protein
MTTRNVFAGCSFADFDGENAAYVYYGGTLSLVGCSFEGNTIFHRDWGAAVIEAQAGVNYGDTEVRLEGCTFSDNVVSTTLPTLLADNRASEYTSSVFYSDSATPSVCTYEGPDQTDPPPPCENSKPRPLSMASDRFLTASNAWFLEVQQVLPLHHACCTCMQFM